MISIAAHFSEMKNRLFYSAVFYIITVVLCYSCKNSLYDLSILPLAYAKSMSQLSIRDLHDGSMIMYTNLAEAFVTYVRLSMIYGFIISVPFFLFQIYKFLVPGLFDNEKIVARAVILFGVCLFYCGIGFTYFILMPEAWKFFLSFEQVGSKYYNVVFVPKLCEYLDLYCDLIIAVGVSFQFPILLLLLILSRFVTTAMLKSKRRVAIVIFFVCAGIITPPDILSQIMVALPMILLYEITILIGGTIEKQLNRNTKDA